MNINGRITFGHQSQSANHNYYVKHKKDFMQQNQGGIHENIEYDLKKTSLQQLSDKVQLVQHRFSKKQMINKLNQLYQSIYQLIFLKETIMSMLNEQKIKTGDFIREIKKYIFQLEIKVERDNIERQSRISGEQRQSKISPQQNNSIISLSMNFNKKIGHSSENGKDYNDIQKSNIQLQRKCQQLKRENEQLKLKFEKSLSKYQREINEITYQSTSNVEMNHENLLEEENSYLKQCIEESNKILKNQQQRYKQKIKYLENEIISLEQQYLKQKQATDREIKRYKQKQKSLIFQEAEIERKNILLIERQKNIFEKENFLKQEKNAIQRRENKISDYEHNQMRREKQQKEMERNNLRTQYYGTLTNIPLTKNQPGQRMHTNNFSERERSNSSRYISSGMDINARLKEIEQQKRKLGFNGIKGSRISEVGYRRPTQNRSFSRENNFSKPFQQTHKAAGNQNVNMKLNDMLSNLQRDLNDIN